MERRGLTEFEAGTYKLKIVNQGGKLPLILNPSVTPDRVPDEFRKEIPARWEFKKDVIESALKAGQELVLEVPVGELDGGASLRVKWARYGDRPAKLKIS